MAKTRTHSFLIKTRGWLLTAGTYQDVIDHADFSTWCANGTFAWAEQQKIELTGLAVGDTVAFPQGWSVQEMTPPEGYCYGLFNTEYTLGVTPDGLPWYGEIHDFWTTKPMEVTDFHNVVGRTVHQRYGPAMEGYAQVPAQSPTFNWEQVIACRSRMWAPAVTPAFDYGRLGVDQAARQQFNFMLHDNTWGSGEAVASLDIFHCRIYISNMDTQSTGLIEDETQPYCDMPPSLQPMLVVVTKPSFLEKMTMVRRSKGI